MQRLKVLSVLLFLVSAAGFTLFQVKQMKEEDKLAPLITIDEKIRKVGVSDGEERLLEGISAMDTKDGDVTGSVVVEGLSPFLGDNSRRLVTYAAFDSDNHVSRASGEIVYTDYTSPRFALKQPLRFSVGKTELTEFMTVTDCLDGNLTDKIKITPDTSITVDVAGEYDVQFQVANSAGDVVYLPVTIELYENGTFSQTPQIGLSRYLVYTSQDKKIDPAAYLETVSLGGTEYEVTDDEENYGDETIDMSEVTEWTMSSSRIKIMDPVDYNRPGTYEILYSMTDENGITGKVRLIVVVQSQNSKEEA